MENRETILCVDDEPLILMLLKKQLTMHFGSRVKVESAQSGVEALEFLEDIYQEGEKVKVVLSDWIMPGMRGDEFLTKVKNQYPEINLIVVSGQVDDDSLEKVKKECELKGFFNKPWDFDDLASKIEKLF